MWRRRGAKGERREREKNERMGKKGFLSMAGWKGETPPPPPPPRVELIARGRKGGERKGKKRDKNKPPSLPGSDRATICGREEGRKKPGGYRRREPLTQKAKNELLPTKPLSFSSYRFLQKGVPLGQVAVVVDEQGGASANCLLCPPSSS